MDFRVNNSVEISQGRGVGQHFRSQRGAIEGSVRLDHGVPKPLRDPFECWLTRHLCVTDQLVCVDEGSAPSLEELSDGGFSRPDVAG